MINIGTYNTLKMNRSTAHGVYLMDDVGEEVLMPKKYAPETFTVGSEITVFVYPDHEGRKVATSQHPYLVLNEFAFLKVQAVTNVGAFVDWGLDKDLLVPFNEQKIPMQEGQSYVICLREDKVTDRLIGSRRIDKFLDNQNLTVKVKQEVDLLIYRQTDLGFVAIVNQKHKGLIYINEVFKDIRIGDDLKGFIKDIRDENKIDLSLQPIGYQNFIDENTRLIYQTLFDNKGFLPLTDKSSPEDIYRYFEMSKKSFKKSIGDLYKKRRISLETDGIRLVD
jgi:predicted RNA-binding protein (virulence factor B family)